MWKAFTFTIIVGLIISIAIMGSFYIIKEYQNEKTYTTDLTFEILHILKIDRNGEIRPVLTKFEKDFLLYILKHPDKFDREFTDKLLMR